ncbi:MAG: O-antigen ligase family protein [Acidobacteriota bacterium]
MTLLAWIHLGAVVLVAPLLLFPRIAWMPAALIVPAIWLVSFAVRRHFVEPNLLNPLLFALLVMVGVSVWATFDVAFSLGKIAGTLLGVFLFLAAIQWIDRRRRLWIGVGTFLVAGVSFAILGFLVTPFSPKLPVIRTVVPYLPARIPLPVPEGSLNANPVGGSLVLFLPLMGLLGWWLYRTATGRSGGFGVLVILAALASLAVLILSQSRSAWVGFAASIGLLLAIRYRWLRWAILVGLACAVVTLAVWRPWNQQEATQAFDEATGEIGLSARLEIWDRAVYGIQDFPFTGMGMNAFRKVVHLLYPLFLVPPDTDIASAHNQFLQTALDLGIPGLVAYIALWAAIGRMLWFTGSRGGRLDSLLAAGLAAGFLAQLVYMMTDAIPLGAKLGIFWWMAAILVVASFKLAFGWVELSRWRVVELLLTWVLISLVSISFVGDHPFWALAIAAAGGIYIGFLAIPNLNRQDAKSAESADATLLGEGS